MGPMKKKEFSLKYCFKPIPRSNDIAEAAQDLCSKEKSEFVV